MCSSDLIVLHHLSSINMTWETFMERVAAMFTASLPFMHSTSSPSLSTLLMEVGSSIMQTHISEAHRVFEFTHTYEKGNREVFAPKSIKGVITLDTIAKQSEIEEKPLMHQDETHLHQHSELAPLEVEVSK